MPHRPAAARTAAALAPALTAGLAPALTAGLAPALTAARRAFLAAALAAAAAPVLAHTGAGPVSGLAAGLAHPVLGADHLLAMVAVGLWSGLSLPRAPWAGAAAFLSAMAAGAAAGFAGLALPMVEAGIALSVVVLGLLVLAAAPDRPRWTRAAALAAIAGFAAFHGHAHASEATGAAVPYVAGFLATTAALHLAGIALARRVAAGAWQRGVGGGIAAAGLAFLVA